jgi:hypothetical protein
MRKLWILSFAIAGILSYAAHAQDATGLIAAWEFNENEGDVAFDAVGDHHGTLQNAEWVDGVVLSGIRLSGEGAYVDCGSVDQLIAAESTTITGWVRFSDEGLARAVVSVGNGVGTAPQDYALLINHTDSGTMRAIVSNGTELQIVRGLTQIGDDLWHHFAFVMSAEGLALYIDGELDVALAGRTVTPWWQEEFGLCIGDLRWRSPSDAWKFKGDMDEIRIYDKALSDEEIGDLFGSAVAVLGVGGAIAYGAALSWSM